MRQLNTSFITNEIDKEILKTKMLLSRTFPFLKPKISALIYDKCISLHQSNINNKGLCFERAIQKVLRKNHIKFKSQVAVDSFGYIQKKYDKSSIMNIVDIVVGKDIQNGKHISEFAVLSCKTSCRERWLQDSWTLNFKPKKYLLLTLSSDYPSNYRFNENDYRKIITNKPKRIDLRKFKLNFDDIVNELKNMD